MWISKLAVGIGSCLLIRENEQEALVDLPT